ncbi:BnaC08g47010D [Brassica napus]|uniref:BnaC08g47010D protein n=2 Tax=Brassica TaxID=3705 RepID=A0A078I267_BRANA|nr:BnaC08g47010D [Brassica napus]
MEIHLKHLNEVGKRSTVFSLLYTEQKYFSHILRRIKSEPHVLISSVKLNGCAKNFAEGFRAVLVDKDQNPKRNPASIEESKV